MTDELEPRPKIDSDVTTVEDALPSEEGTSETIAEGQAVVIESEEVVGEAIGAARLVVKRNGAETDIEFTVVSPSIIGRFDPAVGPVDIDLGPLPEGVYVSRKHARLSQTEDGWTIEDMGSANGTFVFRDGDYERVERSLLSDGDEVALGNARFVFHC